MTNREIVEQLQRSLPLVIVIGLIVGLKGQ